MCTSCLYVNARFNPEEERSAMRSFGKLVARVLTLIYSFDRVTYEIFLIKIQTATKNFFTSNFIAS